MAVTAVCTTQVHNAEAGTSPGNSAIQASDANRAPESSPRSALAVNHCRIEQFQIDSRYQRTTTQIHVVLPSAAAPQQSSVDPASPQRRFPVIYVLPVEAGNGTRWGNAVEQICLSNLPNRHQVICVVPEFADLPWYADHPTDPAMRQESYFLNDVIPQIESRYPTVAERKARYLIGFSKSGWGAWSLLLRHPERFQAAAAFDAPMMMDAPGKYGSGPIFGTAENFAHYQITELLTKRQSELKEDPVRLVLMGDGNFTSEHQQVLKIAEDLQIPVESVTGRRREHSWGSGWLPVAAELLLPQTNQ
ncbi:MAG: hypothetical protein KDA96_10375 [Planctomycetaceae bacterium]|nr:hypothetical protein [Planctomycetaceae bacterium]